MSKEGRAISFVTGQTAFRQAGGRGLSRPPCR
jgi:hypothetical protein